MSRSRIYLTLLSRKLATLRALAADYSGGNDSSEVGIRRIVKSIEPAADVYGFSELTAAARNFDSLEAKPGDNPETNSFVPRLNAVLAAIDKLVVGVPKDPTCLYIGNDPRIVEMATAALKEFDLGFANVEKKVDSVAALRRIRPMMIIMELVLPDGDGRILLRELKAIHEEARDTSCFVVGPRVTRTIRAECLALGADEVLEKPLTKDSIISLIEHRTELNHTDPETVGPAHAEPSHAEPNVTPARAERVVPKGVESERPVSRTENPPELSQTKEKLKVIVGEDDDLIAALLKHWLLKAGYEVEHHDDGIKIFNSVDGKTDLLILDVCLPSMGGFEILRKLKAQVLTRNVPVMMLTSMGSEDNISRGLALGAEDYVTKPFSPAEVIARAKKIIKSRK
jgi:DNA-binding response OmpR family regulator